MRWIQQIKETFAKKGRRMWYIEPNQNGFSRKAEEKKNQLARDWNKTLMLIDFARMNSWIY